LRWNYSSFCHIPFKGRFGHDNWVLANNGIEFTDRDTILHSADRFEELPEDSVPVFDNSDYRRRLESLNKRTTIELEYNNYVQAYINLYTIRKRDQVSKMLTLKEYYYPMFEKVFKEQGIPDEMKHLAMVESALNPFAISRVGATGIWQFMYATGKLYKLNVDTYEDDRRDPLKATYAAAQYFKNMYEKYGDWLLVIASYNCGPGNVNKAIRRAGGVKDFWAIRKFLPVETRGYVPAFIAVNYVMNHSEIHNIHPVEPIFSHKNDTVEVNSMLSFERLASSMGMTIQDVKYLNPVYKRGIVMATSESPKKIVIPSAMVRQFAKVKDSLLVNQPPVTIVQYNENKPIMHKIRSGETVSTIAQKYGVSMTSLKSWNKLSSSRIYAGNYLKIYKSSPEKVVVYAEASDVLDNEVEQNMEMTQNSDPVIVKTTTTTPTQNTVAQNTILTIQQLEEKKPVASTSTRNPTAIDLDSQEKSTVVNTSSGRVVNLSSSTSNYNTKAIAESQRQTINYKVKYGDTLFMISKRYGTTVDAIMKQNGITNPRMLKAGALLKIQTLKG
jgi:membrane-bound lytic murein transglycosylase D